MLGQSLTGDSEIPDRVGAAKNTVHICGASEEFRG